MGEQDPRVQRVRPSRDDSDTAAHLADCVLPEVPVRQWVLWLPFQLRYRLAYDAPLTSQVLSGFLRALFASLRRRARKQWSINRRQCGAVTFVQRFASALNLNLHFHTLALDGVYEVSDGGTPHFRPLPPPEDAEVARVVAATARGLARVLESHGLGPDSDLVEADPLARDEPLLAALAAASLQGRVAATRLCHRCPRSLNLRQTPLDYSIDHAHAIRFLVAHAHCLHARGGTAGGWRNRTFLSWRKTDICTLGRRAETQLECPVPSSVRSR